MNKFSGFLAKFLMSFLAIAKNLKRYAVKKILHFVQNDKAYVI
jgi:hypothetical protein